MADLATLQQYITDAANRKQQAIEYKEYYKTKMQEADAEVQSINNEIESYKQQVQYEKDRLDQVVQESQSV